MSDLWIVIVQNLIILYFKQSDIVEINRLYKCRRRTGWYIIIIYTSTIKGREEKYLLWVRLKI